MEITTYHKQACVDILQTLMKTHPEAVRLFYRHTDGTIRLFRYSDMEYMGVCDRDFPHAPPITPELAEKVRIAESKPAG